MLNPYHDALDIKHILDLQNVQHQNALYLEEEVPANAQVDAAVQIASLGHFMLLSLTGAYSTKEEDTPGVPLDSGRCLIFIQMLAGGNQRPLFEDFIWAGLFLSPGRFKALAASGAASSQLYLEFPFIYTFPNNGQITMKIRNDSDFANIVRIMFKGIRIFPKTRNRQ